MKLTKYILAIMVMAVSTQVTAQSESPTAYLDDPTNSYYIWGPNNHITHAGVIVRAGYVLGGTMPFPLPRNIRKMNTFKPKGGLNIGVEAYKMFNKRWGMSIGWQFFWEGFSTSADVMNYHMSIKQDGNSVTGYFTGTDVTRTEMVGMTIPFLVKCRLAPRWTLSAGPFVSILFKKSFEGEVYDNDQGIGYFREDTPTGRYIVFSRENPATYDFANDEDHMLNVYTGLEVCVDWKMTKRFNLFGKVDWGLSDIFESDFDAITFRMCPIYGTFGVAYRY